MKNWMINGLKAVLALLFGFLALQNPEQAIVILASYFGIFAIIAGLIAITLAFRSMRRGNRSLFWFVEGGINIVIGVVVVAYPEVTAGIFIIFFGIWALIISIIQLIAYNRYQRMGVRAGFILLNAIVSLIVGLLLLFNPFEGAKAVVLLIGVYAVFYGIFSLVQAFISASES